MNPIDRANANADLIIAANAEIEAKRFASEHFQVIHITDESAEREAAKLRHPSNFKAPRVSDGGFQLHQDHADAGQAIRREAERELVNRHGRGRSVIVANVVAAHRAEYDAIVADLLDNL